MKYEIREYLTKDKQSPFQDWLKTLDKEIAHRAEARIFRFELGNLGDYKSLGNGIFEARLMFGSGYRLYLEYIEKLFYYCSVRAISKISVRTL